MVSTSIPSMLITSDGGLIWHDQDWVMMFELVFVVWRVPIWIETNESCLPSSLNARDGCYLRRNILTIQKVNIYLLFSKASSAMTTTRSCTHIFTKLNSPCSIWTRCSHWFIDSTSHKKITLFIHSSLCSSVRLEFFIRWRMKLTQRTLFQCFDKSRSQPLTTQSKDKSTDLKLAESLLQLDVPLCKPPSPNAIEQPISHLSQADFLLPIHIRQLSDSPASNLAHPLKRRTLENDHTTASSSQEFFRICPSADLPTSNWPKIEVFHSVHLFPSDKAAPLPLCSLLLSLRLNVN